MGVIVDLPVVPPPVQYILKSIENHITLLIPLRDKIIIKEENPKK